MADDLWSWQDREAERLIDEGKGSLAGYWHELGELVDDAEALGSAASLAAELDEPWWELFFTHWHVQTSLYRGEGSVQELDARARRLEELASSPACSSCPQRFCARESLCNVREAIDAPGFAPETLRIVAQHAGQIGEGLECRGCYSILEAGAHLELGAAREARAVLDPMLALDLDTNHRFVGLLFKARAAELDGTAEEMGRLVTESEAMLGQGLGVNQDNEWFLDEMRLRHALREGRLDVAAQIEGEARRSMPAHSVEALRIGLAMAEARAAAGDWSGSLEAAERARRPALQRGMTRRAAEACLLAAEACAQLGDTEGKERFASLAESLVTQLRSRDLDERARRLGATL